MHSPAETDSLDMARPGLRLDPLFRARSVALIGLSGDSRKMTGAPLAILRRTGFKGNIYPVNPRYPEIGGEICYPSIAALPETPDVAVIMLAAKYCADAIRECAVKGIRAALILSSGFEETDDGKQDAENLALAVHETGLVMLGPNCEGLWSVREQLLLTFGSAAKRDELVHAPVAIISQSGAMAGAVARHLQNDRIGCAYVISVGNETALTIADYFEWLIEQDDVRVILLFIEGLRDGARLLELVHKANLRGIRVAALKSGNSAAGMEAATSHTGKIASEYVVYRDLLAEAGVVQLDSLAELILAAEVLGTAPLPPQRGELGGVAVFSVPGGTRALTADQCDERNVPLATFDRATVAALTTALPEFGGVENPTDLTGQVLSHPGLFDQALAIIASDPHTEALIVQVANRGPLDVMERVPLLAKVARETGVPVIASFLGDQMPASDRAILRDAGVLCARDPAEAALYLGWLYQARGAVEGASVRGDHDAAHGANSSDSGLVAPRSWDAAVAWVDAAGIAMPSWRLLAVGSDFASSCEEMQFPLALKALPEDAEHKTEQGLLSLNLRSVAEVEREAGRIRSAMRKPDAQLLLQEMVPDGVEVLLAAVRNPDFGPVLAIGLGGIAVELFRDVAWLALPTTPDRVRAAIARLRLAVVLAGFRGKPAADIDALAVAATQFGACFLRSSPAPAEMEINPLFVRSRGQGVVAVDVLIKN